MVTDHYNTPGVERNAQGEMGTGEQEAPLEWDFNTKSRHAAWRHPETMKMTAPSAQAIMEEPCFQGSYRTKLLVGN
jgi:hypothetical protein